jgi:hypothetical protein
MALSLWATHFWPLRSPAHSHGRDSGRSGRRGGRVARLLRPLPWPGRDRSQRRRPNLAGQHELYHYNQLKAFAAGKHPHREMRYMSRHLTDADMREIAQCYERLLR